MAYYYLFNNIAWFYVIFHSGMHEPKSKLNNSVNYL